MRNLDIILIVVMSIVMTQLHAQESSDTWNSLQADKIVKTTRLATPANFHTFQLLDYQDFFDRMMEAPERFQTSDNPTFTYLPMPDGSMELFEIRATPLLKGSSQDRFPYVRSYTCIGIDNPSAKAKIDFGVHGFHGMIRIPEESPIFIDPYRIEDQIYMVYRKADYPSPEETWTCETQHDDFTPETSGRSIAGDCEFRRYRLALACTGEYAQYHGGNVPGVVSAFNTSMNRVNGVYEEDLGITMIFVEGNENLIFLDGNTDPYTNGNGGAMLGENQTTCDGVIGSANYDIGHVFSTGGGGVASLRSPCRNNRKARGVTGRGTPIGDPFDIDYVAHEMGHQYGGNHTQNNSCNRSNASYEPGSASTIMGYAGICNPNVQSNSDPYFHAVNVGEVAAFVTNTNTGGSCDEILSTANGAPVADAGLDYTIPPGTPFALNGSATDPNNDIMTYCWEQYNNDVSTQPPSANNTQGPNFRSILPKLTSTREFPDKGVANTWEVVSNVDRTFDFRLTVRDFNNTLGYGCTDEDDIEITVFEEVGPFEIIAANGGETWPSGSSQTVTWDVASTNIAPINAMLVNILLSTDGGDTYTFVLASNVTNDGSHQVTLPVVTTSQAKLKVEAADNVFFDISDNVFTIDDGNCASDNLVFNSGMIPTGDYFANIAITASVPLITNADVLFQSGEINLLGGFEVDLGAEFVAVIGGCP